MSLRTFKVVENEQQRTTAKAAILGAFIIAWHLCTIKREREKHSLVDAGDVSHAAPARPLGSFILVVLIKPNGWTEGRAGGVVFTWQFHPAVAPCWNRG